VIFGIFESPAQFLEVVGVWLAATATFAAAVVALRVANRANAQYVKVLARPMVEVERGSSDPFTHIFCVSATNLGIRPVTIRSIAIKSHWPRYSAVIMEGQTGSSPLPLTLTDGEAGTWTYAELSVDGKSWYRGFAEHFKQYNFITQWVLVHNLRFFVVTTLGKEFSAPPSSGLRKKIREQITEIRLEK